jgi:hypothetical protein
VFPALLLLGCSDVKMESSRDGASPADSDLAKRLVPKTQPSSFEFEPAMLVMAAGEKIDVEEPGYACPTLFDFDKDGSEDLIVGQFNEGKMKWYRNLSSPGETPKYAAGEWINSGDDPAEVPGVS